MKREIISLLCPLFFVTAAVAQPWAGRDLPRTRTVSHHSEQEAMAATGSPSKYFQPLEKWDAAGRGVYKTTFKVPFEWADRRYFLHVGSAGAGYSVWVNGERTGHNHSAATAAEFDLTGIAKEGINTLEIRVSDSDMLSKTSSNSLGEVYIVSQPRVRIRDYVASPLPDAVELGVIVKSHLLNPKSVRIHYSLLHPDGTPGPYGHRDANFEMKLEDTVRFYVPLPDPKLWSHEAPHLYTLNLKLQHEGRYAEYISYKVGLRTIGLKEGRLMVNGHPVALTEKNTLVLHRPVHDSVYADADRRGLYVLSIADIDTSRHGDSRARGGNPSNNPQWEQDYVDRALTLYHNAKSHSSAAIFMLAEKSSNGYNLYESYLALKAVEPSLPVIYPDGGEWNSDTLRLNEPAVTRPQVEIVRLRDTVYMDGKRERRAGIFQLTNRCETASLRDIVVDWRSGKTRGSATLDGTLSPACSREFLIPGTIEPIMRAYRPFEPFDTPGLFGTPDKRRLIPLAM